MFEKWSRRRKAKRLIELAVEALYLERFDIDALVKELSPGSGRVDLVHAYVSIQVAARLTEPLSEKDIDYALKEIGSSEQLINEPAFETVLDLLRNLAEVYWLNKTAAILEGKLASKANEYSYEGIIYRFENTGKRPASNQEREKFRKLANELNEVDEKLEKQLAVASQPRRKK
jgi:hypothetical protein